MPGREDLTNIDGLEAGREETDLLSVDGLTGDPANGDAVVMQAPVGVIGADAQTIVPPAPVAEVHERPAPPAPRHAAPQPQPAPQQAAEPVAEQGPDMGATARRPVPSPQPDAQADPYGDGDMGPIHRRRGMDYRDASPASEPSRKGGEKKRRKGGIPLGGKIAIGVGAVLVAGAVGAWAYGRNWYSSHLFPAVTVDGTSVGGMTASEAREATSVDRWEFDVVDGRETYHLGASDVDFRTDEVDFDAMIARQDTNMWFAHVISPDANDTVRSSTYDADALRKSVDALPCVGGERQDPADAGFERPEGSAEFRIVDEIEGDRADAGKIRDAVSRALEEGRNGSIDLEKEGGYLRPAVYRDNESLVRAVDTANKWMSAKITYDIDGLSAVETLGPETIAQWVGISRNDGKAADEGNEGEQAEEKPAEEAGGQSEEAHGRQVFGAAKEARPYQVSDDGGKDAKAEEPKGDPDITFDATFDEGGLRAWLAGIGEEYDTAGKPRTITTPTGRVATVDGGGNYGWITDEATEFEAAKASIQNGEVTQREFAMKQRAALPKGQNEWGNTYIEIDLSAQHLWYIRNGEVVLSYGVITGKRGYETPTMVSSVQRKTTNEVLISPWKDPVTGEPTYKTHIDVGLVISDDGAILCHDAPWQPSYGFGDSSYHYGGGSHGCCNMRTGDCWELYNTASVGDPVVVHY